MELIKDNFSNQPLCAFLPIMVCCFSLCPRLRFRLKFSGHLDFNKLLRLFLISQTFLIIGRSQQKLFWEMFALTREQPSVLGKGRELKSYTRETALHFFSLPMLNGKHLFATHTTCTSKMEEIWIMIKKLYNKAIFSTFIRSGNISAVSTVILQKFDQIGLLHFGSQ